MTDVHPTKRLRRDQFTTSTQIQTNDSFRHDTLPTNVTELGNWIIVYQKSLRWSDRKINEAMQQFTIFEQQYQFQILNQLTTNKDRRNFRTALRQACACYEERVEARRQLLEAKLLWLEEVCKLTAFRDFDQLGLALDVQLEACLDMENRFVTMVLRERLEQLIRVEVDEQQRRR